LRGFYFLCQFDKTRNFTKSQAVRTTVFKNILPTILLSFGAAFYVYATHSGLGLTSDSANYLAAARSLLHSGTLRNADGTAYTNWPPLYPALLALARADLAYVRIGQVMVFLGILFLAFRMAECNISNAVLRLFFMASLVFSTPLLLANVFVWSEGFFVLLTLAAFVCFELYETSGRAAYFWLFIAVSNLICLQRFTGIFFVCGFAVLIFLQQENLKKTVIYSLFSLLGVAAWLLRNTFFEQNPAFQQNILITPPLQSLSGYVDAFGNWFVPVSAFFAVKLIVGVLWFSGILFCQWRFRFKPDSFFFRSNWLALCYLACMVLAGGESPETERFAMPACIWVFGGIAAALDRSFQVMPASYRRIVLVVAFVWLSYPLVRTVKNAVFWHRMNVTDIHRA